MKEVYIPWAAWYGDKQKVLTFPEEWEVTLFPPQDAEEIDDETIRQAFEEPIGTPPLREMARGSRDAVIVVDDLSRPTPAYRLMPFVLEELQSAGIPLPHIRVIIGVAGHRPLTRSELIQKLGTFVVEHLQVRNHHPFENLVYLGKTSFGTPVYINRDFVSADFKLAVGGITPHGGPGFGGGAKLIFPGVAGIESLYQNHRRDNGLRGGLNFLEGNQRRADLEEGARMAGLSAIVNVVVNSRRQVAGVFVGDPIQAHRAGCAFARKVFATPVPQNWDVGIFNAYPKDTEYLQVGMSLNIWYSAPHPIVHPEGTIVLTTASSEGLGYHSLHSPGMRLPNNGPLPSSVGNRRLILFSPSLNFYDLSPEAQKEVILGRSWEEVRKNLSNFHGAGTRCAVFPCGALQLAKQE